MANKLTRCVTSFILLASLISIGGCATPTAIATLVERPALVVPQADVIKMDPVTWTVITEANQQQVFETLKKNGQNPVLFGLTDRNYERLTINTAKVQAFVTQQQAIISAYKAYYIDNATHKVKK